MNPLKDAQLSFIGSGVMAEAIIAGLLRRELVKPEQITGSHPRANRREELRAKYSIRMVESNSEAAFVADPAKEDERAGSIVVLAVKPQRLGGILGELRGHLQQDQLVVSIIAGARLEKIAEELLHPAVVRSMPNTPAQISQGMTVWTSTDAVSET